MKILLRLIKVVLLVALLAAAVFTIAPELGGLNGVFPFAQLLAFPTLIAVAWLVLAALLAVEAVLRAGANRRLSLGKAMVSLAVVAVAAYSWLGVWNRGIYPLALRSGEVAGKSDSTAPVFTILAFNSLVGSAAGSYELRDLVIERRPDIVVLPETSRDQGEKLAAQTLPGKYDVYFSGTDRSSHNTSQTIVMIDKKLGKYQRVKTGYTEFIALEPVADAAAETVGEEAVAADTLASTATATRPAIIGIHTAAPLPALEAMWKDSVATAVEQCEQREYAIVAGDFNATLQHPGLNNLQRCQDAGAANRGAALGTWPRFLPALVAADIDHILFSKQHYQPLGYEVIKLPLSDHRAILTRIQAK